MVNQPRLRNGPVPYRCISSGQNTHRNVTDRTVSPWLLQRSALQAMWTHCKKL